MKDSERQLILRDTEILRELLGSLPPVAKMLEAEKFKQADQAICRIAETARGDYAKS